VAATIEAYGLKKRYGKTIAVDATRGLVDVGTDVLLTTSSGSADDELPQIGMWIFLLIRRGLEGEARGASASELPIRWQIRK
jgi:hypothetical protein